MLEDLVDEVPDNLLDDDEYFARHPEDEEEGENGDGDNDEDSDSDDEHDDGGNEGAESESNSEEAEIVEMAEPMEVEIENVVIEEPVEVASGVEEVVAETPKDAEHAKLKEEYENLKYDYTEVKAECNTLEDEKEMLEKLLEELKPKKAGSGSSSDKHFSDEVVETTEAHVPKVYLTRARGTANVGIRVESPIIIPDEAVAETVISDKAEGKRKLDAIPEIFGDEGSSKKAKIDETVQIEPIQSVAVIETEKTESAAETEVFAVTDSEKEVGSEETVQIEPIQSEAVDMPETVAEVASQFEPVQTDNAPMIEALDDLDDVDFTESEDEAGPERNVVEEIPDDLDQRFAYLEKMKFKSGFT
ncbi:hypothetical protein QVD17_16544 [Tagetes erecta]|uniref:Uncharacterized protein n=1 Tax=Tagetes erecta TaxID=13708 RepID=A0AAD8P0R9_TARER|nr:hypothetical protein QVD17_16544 [Tagetes erecta]